MAYKTAEFKLSLNQSLLRSVNLKKMSNLDLFETAAKASSADF